MKQISIILLSAITVVSCEFLEPDPIQDLTTEELWSHSTFGEGILTYAYSNMRTSYPIGLEYYTDNAVPQTPGQNNLALGGWTLEGNPLGDWDDAYDNIKHLNLFLENSRDLIYRVTDKKLDSALKVQRRGEAFFLRAWNQWELLQYYGGKVDGESMGFPIITDYLEIEDNLNLPRNTYEECVEQIALDLDSAVERLPLVYNGDLTNNSVNNRGRASGLAAMALKARVYLYAASPAYGDASVTKWERAAVAAQEAIDASGGLTGLIDYGNFNDIGSYDNIWVSAFDGLSPSLYFPPSLFGGGLANPSQNLVDAFPAADGYPISSSAAYDSNEPYSNRDPRFERFIFHNEEVFNGTTIQTHVGGADAPGGLSQQATRTGYYLQKLMSNNIDLTPGNFSTDYSMRVFLSRAELYLNFAEAANKAFGPADASLGYSSAEVMGLIRMRAGIDSDAATDGYQDQYLSDQAALGVDAFEAFIQNERRVELCFEGFRFWDIRRLNLPLDHTVRGVSILNSDGEYTYTYQDVEEHTFQDYMRYVPVPFRETLIMSELKQNDGW